MAKIKIYIDPIGNTMNLWWDEPGKAYLSEETDSKYSNDVIIKNKKGQPIGVEIIGLFPPELNITQLAKKFFALKKDEPFLLEAKNLKE